MVPIALDLELSLSSFLNSEEVRAACPTEEHRQSASSYFLWLVSHTRTWSWDARSVFAAYGAGMRDLDTVRAYLLWVERYEAVIDKRVEMRRALPLYLATCLWCPNEVSDNESKEQNHAYEDCRGDQVSFPSLAEGSGKSWAPPHEIDSR